jgi:predicted nucleic acid-binding protein
MLIDSNIIIYASKPEGSKLRSFLDTFPRFVSVISYIESFGYRDLTEEENLQLVRIFRRTRILALTDAIAQQAVTLRQQRRMGLGDAIIAATALVHNLTLVTHNTEDFRQIAGLELLDPLTNNP